MYKHVTFIFALPDKAIVVEECDASDDAIK